MKIKSNDLLETIRDENFAPETFKVTSTKLKKDPKGALKSVFGYLQTALKETAVVEADVAIRKDVVLKFQTNIINLPFNYPNKIEQLTEVDTDYDVNLYAIFEAEEINASHLRIDLMGSVDNFLAGDADVYQNIADWVILQFEKLETKKEK
ncbi:MULTISPECIES: hypothetical protein [Pediococcus]|jgi:hypothetical protein|uniref:Uncharacterized protein n=1 Tax=Pediococcus parvulus TaxID=54062 RepID=A0A176TIX3_9LACO|nr:MULTISPECIES: hypothetical protein [Pediococcus]MCT3027938.1 hypothetical protein [Pediococcus parvulus]MCT3029250.1 hypothetical protein [Pediococcus parvulus]MCT3030189.1 hypothetical protein [Pediococcus parvulus]MDN5575267.1 hypothetical protein [Pediococcus sp.]MDV7694125.1 hypothetical protein [Pediococcus parvulus]